jgi:hypothetical protein
MPEKSSAESAEKWELTERRSLEPAASSAPYTRKENKVQTFLPYPCFIQSAKCLDRQRLGKQRVEVLQIFNALQGGSGWSNHPAVKQWQDHEWWLALYGIRVCNEWIRRGYKDSCRPKMVDRLFVSFAGRRRPWWLGHDPYHKSHQSNLLRKDPNHYGRFGWDTGPDLPYIWPSKIENFLTTG